MCVVSCVCIYIYVNLWFILVSPTAYDLFPQNHVADDEGKTVSVGYWMDLNLCKHFCSENVNCYSFAHCTMNSKGKGDCWLKDKILDGSEPSRDTTTGNQCTTYYQIGNGTLRTNQFEVRVYKIPEIYPYYYPY